MADDSRGLAHSLVALNLAAEVVRSKVYEERHSAAHGNKEQLLDSIATTISIVFAIYEYASDPKVPARALSRLELEGGMFKGGAKELRFLDGRAPRRFLAVSANDISATIEALKRAQA